MEKNIKRMSGRKVAGQSHTVPKLLTELWHSAFFSDEKGLDQVRQKLKQLGCNPSDDALRMALSRQKFLTKRGKRGDYRYAQKFAAKRITLTADVLSEELIAELQPDFHTELDDLMLNYGRSGNCTAFLLRKILEKLIFLTFAKNGYGDRIKDAKGDFVGLKTMLKMATDCKVNGKPFLMPKTVQAVDGIKFLGDTSAHNPLADVHTKTIVPVMPFIITAYSELVKKL